MPDRIRLADVERKGLGGLSHADLMTLCRELRAARERIAVVEAHLYDDDGVAAWDEVVGMKGDLDTAIDFTEGPE